MTLSKKSKPFGYSLVVGNIGIWKHETRPITFCLCVDDFGIKYTSKEDALHLLDSIGTNYKYTCDWSGSNYCGLTLDWHYEHGYVDVSMPGYVGKTLIRLQHVPKMYPQYSPHESVPIVYATKIHDNMLRHLIPLHCSTLRTPSSYNPSLAVFNIMAAHLTIPFFRP